MKRYYILSLVFCVIGLSKIEQVAAQDIHYSQFYNSPHTFNPALSGIYNGDKRYIGSVRDQWRWVPVAWFTFGAGYDQKIYPDKSDNHFWSVGGGLNHDRQGVSRLNTSQIFLTGTYSHLLNKENILTGGLSVGLGSRGFNLDDLTWDNQWNGDDYDPSLPSGEQFNTERINYLETAVGLNYRWQKSSRTHIDAGVGVFHLIEPSAGFYNNDDIKLPRNINLSLITKFQVAERLDLQLDVLQQLQSEYSETLLGGLLAIHVNQDRGKETELHLGMGYRTSGSLIPTAAIQYQNIYVSGSYDIDGTGFNDEFSNRRGAIEFHVRYIITDVKDLKAFKKCPIY